MKNIELWRVGAIILAAMLAAPLTVSAKAPAALTEEQKAAIAHACQDVSTTYTYYFDTNDFVNMPSVFTEDGVWRLPSHEAMGRQAIGELWKSIVASRNPDDGWRAMITNEKIDVIDKDHARGTAYITIYRFDRTKPNKLLSPFGMTRSNDEYVRTPEGWRLKMRQITVVAQTLPQEK
ncbi:MAG: nuclear transport factor 2 family protein [Steroidobacteraceae bacterium]